MPHPFDDFEPVIINTISGATSQQDTPILEIATGNTYKLAEFQRQLPDYDIQGVSIDVEEIQSLNPSKVAAEKAKEAWKQNGYNPVLVEDTSLEIKGLNDRPGTLVKYFTEDPAMRRMIAEEWLMNKDRQAKATVTLAIFDGKEVHQFDGTVSGTIAESLKGTNGFGWDDMFIPDGATRTFAEMGDEEKDTYSMRQKAIRQFQEKPLSLSSNVFMLPEPFESEMSRVQFEKLQNDAAMHFAYALEALGNHNKPNADYIATGYSPLNKEETKYYQRYLPTKSSSSIGLIVTDIDRTKDKIYKNGEPILWQMGPKRRTLALAQRAEFWLKNTDDQIHDRVAELDTNPQLMQQRNNKRHPAVEHILKMYNNATPLEAHSFKELGYFKLSADKEVSRTQSAHDGLFSHIGKYTRSYLGIGSLPPVSGWRDVITTTLIGHMPVFIARNNIFAGNDEQRIQLIKDVQQVMETLDLSKEQRLRLQKNIGVAIGASGKEEVNVVKRFFEKTDISLFRIYTINGDPRVVETAKALRDAFGDNIEIFAGQVTDLTQAKELVTEASVDALIFGHGGGRQCTSAANGMAVTTLEEIYGATTDPFFNKTSLLVEGGVSENIGPLLLLGVDGVLYNQQLVRGTIEIGGIFLQNKQGRYGQPYHGSASAPTMIIEAANEKLREKRLQWGGRTKVPEGKAGFSNYTTKANSMVFWIDEFKHHLARTLADLGVHDIAELRAFLKDDERELLRVVSAGAAEIASPWGTH